LGKLWGPIESHADEENRPDGGYSHIVRGRERLRKTIGQAIGRDRGKWSLVGPNTCWVFCRIDWSCNQRHLFEAHLGERLLQL
jgi:hypothetical protein